MKRTSISPQLIYNLSFEFTRDNLCQRFWSGSRPREYDDCLILALIALKELFGFSYRETLKFGSWFWKEIPCLSDFHYRIGCFTPQFIKNFISFLGRKLIEKIMILKLTL